MSGDEPPCQGSPVRYIIGTVALCTSLVVLAAGFVLMVSALERGQYGTSSITWAVVALGAGGGLLGTGIALLIWEYSVRYGLKH